MPTTKEDIAWFKSTFHPIPRAALPDDCIEYTIYATSPSLDSTNDSETRLRLKEIQKYAVSLQKTYLKEYIWQRQAFALDLEKDGGEVGDHQKTADLDLLTRSSGVSLLRGRTEYGDSIEDEWVIVWLLREISKHFEDAWIKVTDNDGEFLLIEASGSLPTWLEPDVAENRVWINNGQLKIIKPASESRSAKRTAEKLSFADAHHIILRDRKRLMHSTLMEEEAFYRLRNYPAQITENMHNVLATVPRKVAFLLKEKPAFVAPAVEAFYLRDPISLKKLNNGASATEIAVDSSDLVTVSVRFPKVAYAQLKSQDFPAPAALRTMIPQERDLSVSSRAQADTGMKITCGFLMLLTDSQYQDKPTVREMKLLLDDIESGEESLPTNEEISTWPKQQDDEKWLEINYEDLERELGGKNSAGTGKKREFGDKSAQENLQRIVQQFEAFMNDEKAGVDGAGMFDDDDDLDDGDLESDSDDDEDKAASFGEDDFTKLMQEMMGMPPEVLQELMKGDLGPDAAISHAEKLSQNRTKSHVAEDIDADDDPEFEAHMRQIEQELREGGALNLSGGRDPALEGEREDSDLSDDDIDENNDIDVNLAKNLLESFKAQAGVAGPTGNLMGLLGAGLPRDDRDEQAGPSGTK